MLFAEVFFFFAFGFIVYTVLLYPLMLLVFGVFWNKSVKRDNLIRKVDLIIPVHNGEAEIDRKIQNCLELDYPKDSLNIFIVSDGSTDGTEEIAGNYAKQGVQCIPTKDRVGKVNAQNIAVKLIKSEIVVFTDVSIMVGPNALKAIVSNFADNSIGAVSCKDAITDDTEGGHSEKLYITYDMSVRTISNQIGSIIGVTGGFYAVRRALTTGGWNPSFPPDFYVALKAIEEGFRVVQDDRVVARYHTSKSDKDEINRKVRTITRGMWALFSNVKLLNPFCYGLASIQLISHKILRWLTPFFVLICLITSFVLLRHGLSPFYTMAFWIQACFYGFSIAAFFIERYWNINSSVLRFPAMLIFFNIVILLSWKNIITGKKFIIWEPTKRNVQ